MLWYIRKFKDAYLVLLCGKLLAFDKNEVENLTTLLKLDYLRFFLKLPGYELCVSK